MVRSNNAILTITGDVNSEEVLPLVQKYFGSIPRGAEVKKLGSMVPRLSSDIYTGYTDNVYLPMTDIVFPTVPNYHKDEAPLDMLAALMGDGKKSITASNIGCTPLFLKAEPHKTGTKELLNVPFLIHFFNVSISGSSPSK